MTNVKILSSIFIITLISSLSLLVADQPSAEVHRIFFGKRRNLDMELSPEQRIFHIDEDGYFYPGSPRINKKLEVINAGQVPFKICRLKATFHGDIHLATGLQIKILERGTSKGKQTHLLYNGALSNLGKGIEVIGKRAVPQRKSIALQITVWMPNTAGNEYQGLSMTADIAITVHYQQTYHWEKT